MAHLGENLKQFRESKKWTQPQMADYLHIGYRTYQSIEATGLVKKAEDLKKIDELFAQKPAAGNLDGLLVELIRRQNELMIRQNMILERQADNVEAKVKSIDSNLSRAMEGLEVLELQLHSGRQVVLQSLARLEKRKNHDELLQEADKIMKIKGSRKQDKKPA